jgi:Transposase domain (DUF772)
MLGVLLYGYCLGVRSSRQIERRCQEDIAFRILAGNQAPDHVTVARFRVRHEQALAGFLVESLRLCAAAGMVRVGTVALDGTKLAADASDKANRTHDKLEAEVAEILRQAAHTDEHEDGLFGDARGDELPKALASKADRLARLRQARPSCRPRPPRASRPTSSASPPTPQQPKPRAASPTLKRRPQEASNSKAVANATDLCSRFLHTRNGTVQGYNAQAVTTLEQVIVAAELTGEANDVHQLQPMLYATATTLAAAGIDERPETALADSGYWSIATSPRSPTRRNSTSRQPSTAARASLVGTASRRRPGAMGSARRCGPSSRARMARPATPSAGRRSSRSSARSRSSRARGGSCAAACAPATPSGSCCAAPTTCSLTDIKLWRHTATQRAVGAATA